MKDYRKWYAVEVIGARFIVSVILVVIGTVLVIAFLTP